MSLPLLLRQKGFNPLSAFAPLHGWDAKRINGANGSNVTSFTNAVAGGPALTPTGTAPTLAVGIKNGRNAIRFPGGDRRLTCSDFAVAIAQPFYIFSVWQADTGANYRMVDSSTSRTLYGVNSSNGYNMQTPAAGAISSANGLNDGSWTSLVHLYNGASSSLTRNGVQIITGTVTGTAMNNIILGADNTGSTALVGYCGEVWIVPAANVNAAKLAAWESYALTTWGL